MDPLKKIQVEGYAMFAEPELLFGNLDELCCVSFVMEQNSIISSRIDWIVVKQLCFVFFQQVTYSFCKEFINLLLHHAQPGGGDTKTTHILTKLFQKVSRLFDSHASRRLLALAI